MLQISVGVIFNGLNVLIGRRNDTQTLGGYWEFPGGKVNRGETFESAVVRECHEETGLTVEIVRQLHEQNFEYDHGQHHLRFFACRTTNPNQPPTNGFRWIDCHELPQYEFPPANAEVLKRITGPID